MRKMRSLFLAIAAGLLVSGSCVCGCPCGIRSPADDLKRATADWQLYDSRRCGDSHVLRLYLFCERYSVGYTCARSFEHQRRPLHREQRDRLRFNRYFERGGRHDGRCVDQLYRIGSHRPVANRCCTFDYRWQLRWHRPILGLRNACKRRYLCPGRLDGSISPRVAESSGEFCRRSVDPSHEGHFSAGRQRRRHALRHRPRLFFGVRAGANVDEPFGHWHDRISGVPPVFPTGQSSLIVASPHRRRWSHTAAVPPRKSSKRLCDVRGSTTTPRMTQKGAARQGGMAVSPCRFFCRLSTAWRPIAPTSKDLSASR